MFFNTLSYFKFLLKSQNQHGLHSPFVYDFVTKGLYKKKSKNTITNTFSELKNLSTKQQKLLSKILEYFKVNTIYFDFIEFSKSSKKNYNLLLIEDIHHLNEVKFTNLNSKHFIVISGVYQDKKSNKLWEEIIKIDTATVTIDIYYFGLIFFRKEQVKEHFIIRS